MRPILSLALLLVLLSGCARDRKSELARVIQARLDSLTGSGVVPGATFAVSMANQPLLCFSSGWADRENRLPMPGHAVMFTGSVGKTFVAARVLQLVQQGKIDLSEKVSHYLGEEEHFMKLPNAAEMTVEMLLNHTAGVPEYVYSGRIWLTVHDHPDKTWTPWERLSDLEGKPPVNLPGKAWSYADSHYILLGCIIEKAGGMSYDTQVTEEVINRVGLRNTVPANRRDITGLVPGYTELTKEMMLPRKVTENGVYAFNPQLEWTGGGLVTTVSDLAAWARELYAGDLLSPEMKKSMVTRVPFPAQLPFNAGYGLGTMTGGSGDTLWYGHTGFVPGYITIFQYVPAYDLALAMQVNSDSLHGRIPKEWFDRTKKIILKEMKIPF